MTRRPARAIPPFRPPGRAVRRPTDERAGRRYISSASDGVIGHPVPATADEGPRRAPRRAISAAETIQVEQGRRRAVIGMWACRAFSHTTRRRRSAHLPLVLRPSGACPCDSAVGSACPSSWLVERAYTRPAEAARSMRDTYRGPFRAYGADVGTSVRATAHRRRRGRRPPGALPASAWFHMTCGGSLARA
jgi:hypothetical protein